MRPSSGTRIDMLSLVFAALGAALLLFIVAPLAGMFLNCTPGELAETAIEAEVQNSIWLTLWTSMAAPLLFAVAAIPFAYLLARKDLKISLSYLIVCTRIQLYLL